MGPSDNLESWVRERLAKGPRKQMDLDMEAQADGLDGAAMFRKAESIAEPSQENGEYWLKLKDV